MASRKNRSRRNRSRKNRNNRNRRMSYQRAMYGGSALMSQTPQSGGACGLGGAPYGMDLMASSGAQSLAQGRQFAEYTRPYHGGSRRMRGGMAPLTQFGADGAGVLRAEAHLGGQDAALREAAAYSATHPDLPVGNFINDASTAVAKGAVNPMAGGRRRKARRASRKASRKVRKSRKARRHGRKGKRSMRRGRKMRGGAIYEGAPYSQSSSDMLLADDAALQAQAAKLESPTWVGVERGTYL
jgi:hypothetical protein